MAIDLTPLYRNSVGFDRLISALDGALHTDPGSLGYPPYNIEVADESNYAITLAVAGFSRDELNIVVENGVLTVQGKKSQTNQKRQFLHQGIAAREFERKFNLAEYVEVTGAELKDGLLTIGLVKHVPEAMKPRRVAIEAPRSVIEHDSGDDKRQEDQEQQNSHAA